MDAFGPHVRAHALIILICPGDNLKAGCMEDIGRICSVAALPFAEYGASPVRLRHDMAMLIICK